jgi:hypothetical protein
MTEEMKEFRAGGYVRAKWALRVISFLILEK